MKRLFAVLAAPLLIFVITATAFAVDLPDYRKDGRLAITWICDGGKTTVKLYTYYQYQTWDVVEFSPSSGELLIYLDVQRGDEGFYIRLVGQNDRKITKKEFKDLLKEKAPSTDCKLQRH